MEWWEYDRETEGDDIEGGALEFDFRLELHVYRRTDGKTVACWLSDDARYYRAVEVGRA